MAQAIHYNHQQPPEFRERNEFRIQSVNNMYHMDENVELELNITHQSIPTYR